MPLNAHTWLEIYGAAAHHEGSITEICRRYGISRQSYYTHLRRLREEGIEGLNERSRRPLRSPRRVPDSLEQRVVELRKSYPWLGARSIRQILLSEGIEQPPSTSTIAHIIRRNGLPPRTFNVAETDTGQPPEAPISSGFAGFA